MVDVWTVHGSQVVYSGWTKVRRDDVEYANGVRKGEEVVEDKPGVHIVAVTDEGKLVLIDKPQYYCGLAHSIELPGGGLPKGKYPDIHAHDELHQETGWKAGRMELLFPPGMRAPWRVDCNSTVYLATNLREVPEGREIDPNEVIHAVLLIPVAQAVREVNNLFADFLTRFSVYWYGKEILHL